MSILEKILQEIEAEFNKRIEIQLKIMAGLGDDTYRYGYGKSLEAYQQGKIFVIDIIRKHMNDGWIPVEEGLPEESLDSVIGWDANRERCCFVQYYMGRWILGNGDEPVKIIAWRPVPKPYKPKEYGLYLQGRRKRRKKR